MLRITPFIAATYPSLVPKSVVMVNMPGVAINENMCLEG